MDLKKFQICIENIQKYVLIYKYFDLKYKEK